MGIPDPIPAQAAAAAPPRLAVLLVTPEIPNPAQSEADARLQYLYGTGSRLHILTSADTQTATAAIRKQVLDIVADLMEEIYTPGIMPNDVMDALSAAGKGLYDDLLPAGLREHLADMARAQRDDNAKVALLINGPLQWMPWELMHDGEEFLSLRFQIARLPVERAAERDGKHQGYATSEVKPDAEVHLVKRIVSVLGARALTDADDGDEKAQEPRWRETFKKAGVPANRVTLLPPTDGAAREGPRLSQLNAAFDAAGDPPGILHITCHGDKSTPDQGTVWTLDSKGLFLLFDLTDKMVGRLCATQGFQAGKPLVFGNACSSSVGGASEVRSLAGEFLHGGASAFVGTIAPITNRVAVEFAVVFYTKLLKEGLPIGEALHASKQEFHKKKGVDPSWLFYCLYGSPLLRYTVEL
jgi:CHAT domain-containing protein